MGNDALSLTSQIFHTVLTVVLQTQSCEYLFIICLQSQVPCLIRWFALARSSVRSGCFLGNACRQEEMCIIHTRKSSGRVQTDEEPMCITVWHQRALIKQERLLIVVGEILFCFFFFTRV